MTRVNIECTVHGVNSDVVLEQCAHELANALEAVGLQGEVEMFEDVKGLWTTTQFFYHPCEADMCLGLFEEHLAALHKLIAITQSPCHSITIIPPDGWGEWSNVIKTK